MSHSETTSWLAVFILVAIAHLLVWRWMSGYLTPGMPPMPLPTVSVSLLTEIPAISPARPQPTSPPTRVTTPTSAPLPAAVTDAPLPAPNHPAPEHREIIPAPSEPTPVTVVATPPPTLPAPPVSMAPTPAPVASLPRYSGPGLHNSPVDYPLMARRRNMTGTVLLRAEVHADGQCGRVILSRSSGYELLDQTALQAVSKWRFVPAKQGDQAVSGWVEIPIVFNLN